MAIVQLRDEDRGRQCVSRGCFLRSSSFGADCALLISRNCVEIPNVEVTLTRARVLSTLQSDSFRSCNFVPYTINFSLSLIPSCIDMYIDTMNGD